MSLPRLYAIADMELLARRAVELRAFAEGLRDGGVERLQLRHKHGSPAEVLACAAVLRAVFSGTSCRLIMNDRADLAALAGFDGVHVGQGDLAPGDARRVLAAGQHRGHGVVGVSTHTNEQVQAAEDVDYVAIGPVFATGTKADAAPVVGLAGVRRARALTARPLVAIGGITRHNCRSVVDAGADCVAVISALLVEGEPVAKVVRDFLSILR